MDEPTDEPGTHHSFSDIARHAADWLGSPWAFVGACVVVLGWALAGPVFGFSDAWQLVINTGTTIATFLMVFLIQNTQNRDARAVHLKLDELIRSQHDARNRLIDLESGTDQELDALKREFHSIRSSGKHSASSRAGESAAEDDTAREHRGSAGVARKAGPAAGAS
jgi:low affinity Fe/Cu permease